MRRCVSFDRGAHCAGSGLGLLWVLFFTGVAVAAPPASSDAKAPHAAPAAPAPTATAAAASAAAADEGDAIDTDSPRRALERFLQNARDGQFAQAADDLWPVSSDAEEMTSLARKLQAVLDRRLPFDAERLAKVSDSPTGNLDDGLPEQDELGRIQMPLTSEPVRMVRKRLANGGTHWVFSPKTLERTPAWFQRLPDHWLLDHMPHFLLVTGPGGLLYWQWLMLPIFFILSGLFGLFFSTVMRLVAWILFGRRELFKAVLERQTAPLRVLGAALALRLLLLSLFMTATAEQIVRGLCNVALIIGITFTIWRATDVLVGRVRQSAWLTARPALVGMAPLLHRLIEVGLWAVAVLWSIQAMGYSVTAVLASFGLGGLAVALAAKNALEHLIGGMTLSLDQPMRVGDQVKVGDVLGHVEQIGIRSTRIRTQDRSLVTIPNGKLADLNIETLAARDRLRVVLTLNIANSLKPKKLRELRDALIACVKEQPLVIQDKVSVNFTGLSEFAIPIEITCFFDTHDIDQFAESRHALLLQVLEVVDFFAAFAVPPKK